MSKEIWYATSTIALQKEDISERQQVEVHPFLQQKYATYNPGLGFDSEREPTPSYFTGHIIFCLWIKTFKHSGFSLRNTFSIDKERKFSNLHQESAFLVFKKNT